MVEIQGCELKLVPMDPKGGIREVNSVADHNCEVVWEDIGCNLEHTNLKNGFKAFKYNCTICSHLAGLKEISS